MYGWVNRALPDEELDEFVNSLARRLAKLSPAQIRAAKSAVNAALPVDLEAGLEQEERSLNLVHPASGDIADRVRRALEGGMQTREQEFDLEGTLDKYL